MTIAYPITHSSQPGVLYCPDCFLNGLINQLEWLQTATGGEHFLCPNARCSYQVVLDDCDLHELNMPLETPPLITYQEANS